MCLFDLDFCLFEHLKKSLVSAYIGLRLVGRV